MNFVPGLRLGFHSSACLCPVSPPFVLPPVPAFSSRQHDRKWVLTLPLGDVKRRHRKSGDYLGTEGSNGGVYAVGSMVPGKVVCMLDPSGYSDIYWSQSYVQELFNPIMYHSSLLPALGLSSALFLPSMRQQVIFVIGRNAALTASCEFSSRVAVGGFGRGEEEVYRLAVLRWFVIRLELLRWEVDSATRKFGAVVYQ